MEMGFDNFDLRMFASEYHIILTKLITQNHLITSFFFLYLIFNEIMQPSRIPYVLSCAEYHVFALDF